MAEASELVAAANLNCVGSYCTLARHSANGKVRELDTAVAFVTGVPIPLFNGCLAMDATAGDAALAIDWMSSQGLPYLLWTADDDARSELSALARGRGLSRESWALPGMVLSPPPAPPEPPASVTTERVHGPALERWLATIVPSGMPAEVAKRLFPPSFAADPDVALFIAYLDSVAVGTSIAIRTGNISGVYAVVTAPSARRRGVGTAAAWAAVNAGREWGCHLVTLQATEMGFSSYKKMGFQTVVRYRTFAPPDAA